MRNKTIIGTVKHFFQAVLVTGMFFVCLSSIVQAEEIAQFGSVISIMEDGSFKVTEKIRYDFGEQDRHGIFRYIPTTHPQEASVWYKVRKTDIQVVSVMRDDVDEPYELIEQPGKVHLKIGSADETITGLQTYTIVYIVHGGLSYLNDGNVELYWNVTGDGWGVSMQRVISIVLSSAGGLLQERACYSGADGAVLPCEIGEVTATQGMFGIRDMQADEGLTIAQSIDKNFVEVQIVEHVMWRFILMPFILLLAGGLLLFYYRFKKHHDPQLPVVAQYEPYGKLKPMYAGVVLDGRLHPRDITAGLIYLAQEGFFKIHKTERKVMYLFEVDDYQVELLRSMDGVTSSFHRTLLELLFENQTLGTKVALSALRKDQSKGKENASAITALQSAVKKDLVTQSFYETTSLGTWARFLSVPAALFVGIFFILGPYLTPELFVLALLSPLLLVFFFITLSRRRTRKGFEAQNHLKGFKLFLSVTDEKRFEFHNAPSKNPEKFMEYLPYAIAFGVEKQWAEVFKDITLPNPDWYDAGVSGGSFSPTLLTTNLGAFSTAFASSSSTSASSGGGFSGGGGGGGGGGSW